MTTIKLVPGKTQEGTTETRPPRVTYSIVSVVAVKIRGQKIPEDSMALPDDGGLIQKFQKWQIGNDLYPFMLQYTGGGGYLAYFDAKDIPAVRRWLETSGAELDDETTWGRR